MAKWAGTGEGWVGGWVVVVVVVVVVVGRCACAFMFILGA